MGKGLALQFKNHYPLNYKMYRAACDMGEVQTGRMFVVENEPATKTSPKWIVNFPTKEHWRHPSKMEWIVDGLHDLSVVIHKYAMKSISIPMLGCGLGGLKWDRCMPAYEAKYFANFPK